MKKLIKRTLFVVLLASSCVNFCYAQETLATAPNISGVNPQEQTVAFLKLKPVFVKPDEKTKSQEPAPKVDLNAIILDQNVETFDSNEDVFDSVADEEAELTLPSRVRYNLNEALHGEVSALTTKGLLADKMKMNFDKGPIESISPWIDYNGSLSNIWKGEDYQNTTYGINFADIGINGKMRDNKTEFRMMISPVRSVEGNTYFNSFFADNYVTRKIGKNNKILIGNTWVPLGIEGKESPLVLQYFTRSQTSRTYSSCRALGAKVMGTYKWADYHLGAYSSGRFFKDFFPGEEVAGWVDFKPLANTNGKYGKLTVGGGFDAGNAQTRYAVATGAINYEYKRWRAITEFGMADGSNGASGFSTNKSQGINGTLSYRVTNKLQTLVRYDQFDPNTEKDNDIRTEYTAGINYFLKDQAMKLMLNYVLYTVQNGTFGSRIMVGTQIVL